MPPTALEPSFPLSITILCYLMVGVHVAILLLLLRINSKLSVLSAKLSRFNRAGKVEDQGAAPNIVEVSSGTHFEEFLNEDPERRKLTKKEQFKAYRAWRTEKGLNWPK